MYIRVSLYSVCVEKERVFTIAVI